MVPKVKIKLEKIDNHEKRKAASRSLRKPKPQFKHQVARILVISKYLKTVTATSTKQGAPPGYTSKKNVLKSVTVSTLLQLQVPRGKRWRARLPTIRRETSTKKVLIPQKQNKNLGTSKPVRLSKRNGKLNKESSIRKMREQRPIWLRNVT